MSDKTGISWTDATWNPIRGCSRVSAGCVNCYAERTAARFAGPGMPYAGLIKMTGRGDPRWSGVVRMVPDHLADPLRWRKPRRIFVNSMSDLFHDALTNEQIAAVFGVMAAAPHHTFQVLTKRARRMREWFAWLDDASADFGPPRAEVCGIHAVNHCVDIDSAGLPHVWPLPNVWLGVSVENQAAADERIPELLKTPAVVRFLSCEPLIGPLVLNAHLWREPTNAELSKHLDGPGPRSAALSVRRRDLHWIIAGCESGRGARPCDVAWLRSLRDHSDRAGVAFFLKQAVSPRGSMADGVPRPYAIDRGAGSKLKQGYVIELPYLDGVQHAAFP